MRGKLPRYTEDDVEFIVRNLATMEPQGISGFMSNLGIDPRSSSTDSTGPSAEYYRIAAAFRRGLASGRLTKNMGQKSWRVAVRPAKEAKAS